LSESLSELFTFLLGLSLGDQVLLESLVESLSKALLELLVFLLDSDGDMLCLLDQVTNSNEYILPGYLSIQEILLVLNKSRREIFLKYRYFEEDRTSSYSRNIHP
jgi:hypothetical protein